MGGRAGGEAGPTNEDTLERHSRSSVFPLGSLDLRDPPF